MPKVKDIVTEYLKSGGFDGLANGFAECGCFLDDLAPCGQIGENCWAGRREVVDGEEICIELHEGCGEDLKNART